MSEQLTFENICWLNALLDVPSALLVSTIHDLQDGRVIKDVIITLLRKKNLTKHIPNKFASLEEALQELTLTFGISSLPFSLQSPFVPDAIRTGDVHVVNDLVAFLRNAWETGDFESLNNLSTRLFEQTKQFPNNGYPSHFASPTQNKTTPKRPTSGQSIKRKSKNTKSKTPKTSRTRSHKLPVEQSPKQSPARKSLEHKTNSRLKPHKNKNLSIRIQSPRTLRRRMKHLEENRPEWDPSIALDPSLFQQPRTKHLHDENTQHRSKSPMARGFRVGAMVDPNYDGSMAHALALRYRQSKTRIRKHQKKCSLSPKRKSITHTERTYQSVSPTHQSVSSTQTDRPQQHDHNAKQASKNEAIINLVSYPFEDTHAYNLLCDWADRIGILGGLSLRSLLHAITARSTNRPSTPTTWRSLSPRSKRRVPDKVTQKHSAQSPNDHHHLQTFDKSKNHASHHAARQHTDASPLRQSVSSRHSSSRKKSDLSRRSSGQTPTMIVPDQWYDALGTLLCDGVVLSQLVVIVANDILQSVAITNNRLSTGQLSRDAMRIGFAHSFISPREITTYLTSKSWFAQLPSSTRLRVQESVPTPLESITVIDGTKLTNGRIRSKSPHNSTCRASPSRGRYPNHTVTSSHQNHSSHMNPDATHRHNIELVLSSLHSVVMELDKSIDEALEVAYSPSYMMHQTSYSDTSHINTLRLLKQLLVSSLRHVCAKSAVALLAADVQTTWELLYDIYQIHVIYHRFERTQSQQMVQVLFRNKSSVVHFDDESSVGDTILISPQKDSLVPNVKQFEKYSVSILQRLLAMDPVSFTKHEQPLSPSRAQLNRSFGSFEEQPHAWQRVWYARLGLPAKSTVAADKIAQCVVLLGRRLMTALPVGLSNILSKFLNQHKEQDSEVACARRCLEFFGRLQRPVMLLRGSRSLAHARGNIAFAKRRLRHMLESCKILYDLMGLPLCGYEYQPSNLLGDMITDEAMEAIVQGNTAVASALLDAIALVWPIITEIPLVLPEARPIQKQATKTIDRTIEPTKTQSSQSFAEASHGFDTGANVPLDHTPKVSESSRKRGQLKKTQSSSSQESSTKQTRKHVLTPEITEWLRARLAQQPHTKSVGNTEQIRDISWLYKQPNLLKEVIAITITAYKKENKSRRHAIQFDKTSRIAGAYFRRPTITSCHGLLQHLYETYPIRQRNSVNQIVNATEETATIREHELKERESLQGLNEPPELDISFSNAPETFAPASKIDLMPYSTSPLNASMQDDIYPVTDDIWAESADAGVPESQRKIRHENLSTKQNFQQNKQNLQQNKQNFQQNLQQNLQQNFQQNLQQNKQKEISEPIIASIQQDDPHRTMATATTQQSASQQDSNTISTHKLHLTKHRTVQMDHVDHDEHYDSDIAREILPETATNDLLGNNSKGTHIRLKTICEWLESMGIYLERPFDLLSSKASEFMDGLILCRIIEICSRIRGGLPGVQKYPKTAAARLANIRRALERLRDNNQMPLDHLWSEHAIREGETAVIVPLLLQIRRAHLPMK